MNKITRLLFSVALLSFALPVCAQLEKGNFLVGGSISFSTSTSAYTVPPGGLSTGDTKTFQYSFNPNISYMVLKNFAVGAIVPVQHIKSSNDLVKSNITNYSLGLALRYYFPFKQWAIFPLISYAPGRTISRSPRVNPSTGQTEETKVKGTTSAFATGVGITYFVNKNVGVEGALTLQRKSTKYDDSPYSNSDNATGALNFAIGMQVYLNR